MNELFYPDESPYYKGYFSVRIPDKLYDLCKGAPSSRAIVDARLLGMTYPDYLLFVQQNFNAILCGKKGYIVALYKNPKPYMDFINEIYKKILKED